MDDYRMYYLKDNKGECYPHDLVFLSTEFRADCITKEETTPLGLPHTHRCLFMGGYARTLRLEKLHPTRRKEMCFDKPADFWQWMADCSRPKALVWTFAHHMSFEMTQLGVWKMADKNQLIFTGAPPLDRETGKPLFYQGKPGMYLTADPPLAIDLWDRKRLRKYRFLDICNYLRDELETIAAAVGLPLREKPPIWESKDQVYDHCKADVEVLEAATLKLLEWWVGNALGSFKTTGPALSSAAYRHRFKTKKILLHQHQELRKLERAAYCGSQAELYRWGRVSNEVHELDVASMYPAIMKGQALPKEAIRCGFLTKDQATEPRDLGAAGIAHVLVKSDDHEYPKKIINGTWYPHGTYWTVLCGPELQAAYDRGHLVRMASWATYELDELFGSFVDFFWQQRLAFTGETTKVFEQFCKLMLNSLPGRFGMHFTKWEPWPDYVHYKRWDHWQEWDAKTGTYLELRCRAGRTEVCIGSDVAKGAFVSIPAFICAHGRLQMRSYRSIAGVDEVYAQLGDSLICSTVGKDALALTGNLQPRELGKLRLRDSKPWAEFWNTCYLSLGGVLRYSVLGHAATPDKNGCWYDQRFDRADALMARAPKIAAEYTDSKFNPSMTYHRGVVNDAGRVERVKICEVKRPGVLRTVTFADRTTETYRAESDPVLLPTPDFYAGPNKPDEV